MTLQERLNARGDVIVTGETVIDQPLIIGPRTNLIGNNQASIRTTYNGPAIKTAINTSAMSFSIRSLYLYGGGIEFPPANTAAPGCSPCFFNIEDVYINGASIAFNDAYSGAWMGRVQRVWAFNGHVGFRVQGGTTKTFTECHVAGDASADVAWDVFAAVSCRFVNCAVDNRALPVSAVAFRYCRGLSVESFYFEGNKSQGPPIVLFDSCDGLDVSNVYSLFSTLDAQPGSGAYLVQVNQCNGVLNALSLGGGTRAHPDKAIGAMTGHTVPLLLTGLNYLSLNGCHITPATKTVLSQTGFGFIDQSTTGSAVTVHGCRMDPGSAPGQG